MGFITMLSREAGTIAYGTRMIEQDRINLSVQVDLGNCSVEAFIASTDVTALTNGVIWFENNFYIPDGVTEFSFEDDGNYYVWTWNAGTTSWDSVEYEIVSYDAGGDAITNIDPATITYDTDRFLVPTSASITSFTFDKGATPYEATFDVTWSFAEVVAAWTPEQNLPDAAKEVEGWYDSADGVTASSPLTRWANKKIDINALPDYINDAFNPPDYFAETEHFNKNIIRFTEGNNEMIQWETNPELSQPFVIFISFRNRRTTNYTANRFVYDARIGNRSFLCFRDTGTYQAFSGITGVSFGSYNTDVTIYTGKHNGASSTFKINDEARFTLNVGTTGLGAMCLGNDNNGGDTSDIDIAEVVVVLGDLSEADMEIVETYLNNKYRS